MLVLIALLAILCLASVGVAVWVYIEMQKDKREVKREVKRRWKSLGKKGHSLKSKIGKRLDEMSREDTKIKKALIGIDERVGYLSRADKVLGTQMQTVKMMMSKEDAAINKRISKMSERDEALRSDVAKMRPILNVASVDASGNLRIAKDRQFCIDTECVSSHDIPKMKKAPLPPIGSVWRCDSVKVDKLPSDPDPDGIVVQFPVAFRMEDQTFPDSIPSYPLNFRITDINGESGPFPPIPIEEDPNNTSKSKILNFYPLNDMNTWNVGITQRLFPMAFNGYDIGSKCTYNFVGHIAMEFAPERKNNSPAVFTRVS
jgi:hypothetical protein